MKVKVTRNRHLWFDVQVWDDRINMWMIPDDGKDFTHAEDAERFAQTLETKLREATNNLVYIVIGQNAWGKDANLGKAKKAMKENGGSLTKFVAFRCHKDTTVSGFDGSLNYPLDHKPVEVERKGIKVPQCN